MAAVATHPILMKMSFYVTYVFLITTGSVTFIEALSNKIPELRHIMNIETVISIIAGFFYSQFVARLNEKPNYSQMLQTRYLDWSITTPFMLLSLCLALGYNIKKKLTLPVLLSIIAMNYGMLLLGYLGEHNKIDKRLALVLSFACFIAMYAIIYMVFVHGYSNLTNLVIFSIFVTVWSIYGFVYYAKDETKNITYNILDLFAKCFTGIFFWMYFTKIVTI